MRLLFDDGIALELYALSYQTSATGEMANEGMEKKIHHIICRFQWDCYREKLLERTTSHVTPVWNDPNGFHKRITNASKWIHNKTITHWKWVVIECALWHSKHFPKDFSNILLPFKQIFVWIPFELNIYLQW